MKKAKKNKALPITHYCVKERAYKYCYILIPLNS